jgi:Uncharacterised nucleotidyltransferase
MEARWHHGCVGVMAERRPSGAWAAAEELVDRARGPSDLRSHKIAPLAARRRRALGAEVGDELGAAELAAGIAALTAPVLLAEVRAACEGPIVVIKGPEAAALYPDAALRPFVDLDLLVPDAPGVQRQLLEGGFVEVGEPERYVDHAPHERPVARPGLAMAVEVHNQPNWPRWLQAPHTDELLAVAVPSASGVDGILALPHAHHALVLAAHAWTHGPVGRLRDLLDVALAAERADPNEIHELVPRWRVERLWEATRAFTDALFFDAPAPLALRTWARNLALVRERTVLETHVGLWVAAFSYLPAVTAFRALLWELASDIRPKRGETWSSKVRRSRKALAHALAPKSMHDRTIDPATEGGARLRERASEERSERDRRDRDSRPRAAQDGEP